jgi:hypothetical protein
MFSRIAVNLIFAFALTAVVFSGCADSFEHNVESAAARAEEFARVTFVNQNVDGGYDLLADGTRRYVTRDKMKEVVARLHPKSYPATVKAGDSEPMHGEKAIYIFVAGEARDEHFYYRLTMEGTAATGYRVLQFDRLKSARGN